MKKIISALLTIALLLQAFTFTALAADFNVTINLIKVEQSDEGEFGLEVGFAVEGLAPNAQFSLVGKYDGEVDYINQYAADEDGAYSTSYPSNKAWVPGKVITVMINGVEFTEEIPDDYKPPTVDNIKIDQNSMTAIKLGKSLDLSVTVTPSDVEGVVIKWSSGNSSIVSVDANGKVTALKAGMATIKAETSDGNGGTLTSTITVRVTA